MNEEETKLRWITPAIEHAGWNKNSQIRMEYFFTDGRVIVQGKRASRGDRCKADYLLSRTQNIPLAVVEAKQFDLPIGAGMQQAIRYAEILDVPFAYSTNGQAFLEHDMKRGVERELSMDEFPSPEALWKRYSEDHAITPEIEPVVTIPYYYDADTYPPRYYQRIAIQRTVEAIARGQNRCLLVMATGTGKTYTAFQIIWRLWRAGCKKRILYLADRNILVDQSMEHDFKSFANHMTKVQHKKLDSSYELYFALYQQLVGENGEETFREFQPEFFDLIIVDECHRGSAKDDSNWRKVLEYFKSATQLGLTATPKETNDVSNIDYFGDPLFVYSLKQGIDDGFLAPYRVVRCSINVDHEGWRPKLGQRDKYNNEIEDREYYQSDMDRNIVIDERTLIVAKRVTQFLKKSGDRFAKTIVFCEDIDHAERMRIALTNFNSDLCAENPNYVMRITGDNPEGKIKLQDFIDPHEKYPVIVTTSELMTTGVDCKPCRLIVLDKSISSMTTFKQIVGRGTRIYEPKDKLFFTILDFKNACRLFADPDFDGDPAQSEEFDPNKTKEPPSDEGIGGKPPVSDKEKRKKYVVNGVEVRILNERVQFLDPEGKLITESIIDFSKRNILGEYATLDKFIEAWNENDKKQAIVDALKARGVLLEALRDESDIKDVDDFDLICHIAWDCPQLTRRERAQNVKKRDFLHKYQGVAQNVLSALLDAYMDAGDNIDGILNIGVLQNEPFCQYGSPKKIIDAFGGKSSYLQAIHALMQEIYL